MTKRIKEIRVEYKYPGLPWVTYDRTKVEDWANTQFIRMAREHPGAEYRKVQNDRELK